MIAATATSVLELGGLSLDFKGSPLLFLLLVIAALGLSALVYRRTTPPSGLGLRTLLAMLRMAVFTLILFLIFEPSISFQRERQLKPLLAIVLDDSESMRIRDASGDRFAQLEALLGDPAWNDLDTQFELAYFAAGDSLRQSKHRELDSLNCRAIGTNLAAGWQSVLKALEGSGYAACVLISDGGNNSGRDPIEAAAETSCPIFTVGIGDTARIRDARIESLIGTEVAYLKKSAQIRVGLRGLGMNGQDAHLELLDSADRLLSREIVKLPPDELETEVTLEFTPTRIGRLPLRVRLVTSDVEYSVENNLRTWLLEVKESHLKVLMISGRPGFESMAFQRIAAGLPDIDVTALTVGKDGLFYAADRVNLEEIITGSDVLVLVDFPRRNSPAGSRTELRSALSDHPLPVWTWLGNDPDLDELERLCGTLPFKLAYSQRSGEAACFPDHFYTLLDPDVEVVEKSLWDELSPLQLPGFSLQLHGVVSQLIGFRDPETGQALGSALLAWESAGRHRVASFGSGYWRWSFLSHSGGVDLYAGMQSRVLRWLDAGPQKRPLMLSTSRQLYSSGQRVDISARVLNGSGQLVTNAHVDMILRSPEGETKILLEPDQQGFYSGGVQPTIVGTYTYLGYARIDGDTLGADSGRFEVEVYNIERETLSQNRPLLEKIASESGGTYLPPDSLALLGALIEAPPRLQETGWERRFFLNWDIWIVIIVLLGLEWLIRKRRGML